MALVAKIDSNVTGLRYCEEVSLGLLNGSAADLWKPLEPNSYNDFGGQLTTMARDPINASRQRKKGVVTDLDASGGFSMDLTQTNLSDMLQGFMFADVRTCDRVATLAAVTTASDHYEKASGMDIFRIGDIVWAEGFTNPENNGVKHVTAINTAYIGVSENLVNEPAPPATASIRVVGFTSAAGDIDVDAAGTWPALTSTTVDFTTFGLVVGSWIYIGGDTAGSIFAGNSGVNNGFKRIRAIAAHLLTLDKSAATMVTEAQAGQAIELYFGDVIKNESDPTLIKRRTYQLERLLGAPDTASPSQIQSEYIVGAVPNEFKINIPTANKVTCDLSFVGIDNEQRSGVTGAKTGTRTALVESDAFNTSSDFSRMRLAVYTSGTEAPSPLFAYVTEANVSINNNASPNKAVAVLGAFDVSIGMFTVSGNITAYFADVAAIAAVRQNKDVSLDFILAKANAGIVFDLPLVTLGDGRADIQKDQPIKLPLSMDAATGAKINASGDHTLLVQFFPYLPTVAEA